MSEPGALHVAFLRGMNLGRRRITNEELVACFSEMGFAKAQAFLASGNVVFEAKPSKNLAQRIEQGLKETLGYPVPTFVRTSAAVVSVANAKPFDGKKRAGQPGKLQVAFLKADPNKRSAELVSGFETPEDWLKLQGRELYWWPKGGISESELDLKRMEKSLGGWTMRTHGTVCRLVKKFF